MQLTTSKNAPTFLKIEFGLYNEKNVYSYKGKRHIIFVLFIFTGYPSKTLNPSFFNHPVLKLV